MTITTLAIVTTGLVTTYIVLVYNIRKYYHQSLKLEKRSLSILFAAFIISYFFRMIFEVILFAGVFDNLVLSYFARTILLILMPLVFDLTSILAILVLHFINFRKSQTEKDRMPEAGHFNPEGGLPKVRDLSYNDESEE